MIKLKKVLAVLIYCIICNSGLKRFYIWSKCQKVTARVRYLTFSLPVSTMNDYKMDGFKYIIDFWKEMVKINHIREGIYYEIYCRTHDKNGSRTYDRYFSTLEYLVTTSCSNVYYPHNVSYEKTGFTFIEEFIECLSSEKFSKILK